MVFSFIFCVIYLKFFHYSWFTVMCFSCRAKWFRYPYIYVSMYLFWILLPNRLVPDIEYVPVLYSRSLLVIYFIYSSIYIGEGNGTPLQYSCLENPTGRGAWWAAVHGVVKSRTRLSDFTFTFHFHALEKEVATHSSVLAWRIPGTGEPGGLPSLGSHKVRYDWSDLAAAAYIC